MAKVKLTAGRVAEFQCPEGKSQAFLWCVEVQGLAVRATAGSTRKRYIFESKVKGKTMRVTIGEVSTWSIDKAQSEARRLQVEIDKGNDPRQQVVDKMLADDADKQAIFDKDAALALQLKTQSITAGDAWKVYVAERGASKIDGKLEWGEHTRRHHNQVVQVGGVKRKGGRKPGDPETTRQGTLVPIMTMRLIDVTDKVVEQWLIKESANAPTSTAKAFSCLRAFITWCTKQDVYRDAVIPNACLADNVKKNVAPPRTRENDSLRRAQIKPWFESVGKLKNSVHSAYLRCLLLTGARRNELAALRWDDVDFKWKSMTIRDKVEGVRTIPLTPYVEYLIKPLPRLNGFVFSSPSAKSGRIEEPRNNHSAALIAAGLPPITLHGLRRSFSTLSEWVEVPAGIVAQIMGHKPSAIAEKHYIQRELDLLHIWHVRIESWILDQAGVEQPKLEE